MALAAGARVGSYQIVSAIGAGGMGEVYRARDSQLHRDVAIKVLPDSFRDDPQRLARFEREARVLAAINHPHIAAIYGIAESEGVRGLVLELVEGETLADRIADGPLALRDTLTIAAQIADALDASHEKGIIHRDLKPSNIKITPDGIVKVLDFGLAKAYEPTPAALDGATATAPLTHDSTVIGTAAFMSPEQARGLPVDKRTDIWSFGCVLFEMLAGRPAFKGETSSDIIAAVLQLEPDWSALPQSTPAGVTRLLKRCLEKEAKRRLRDAGDLRAELEEHLRTGPTARVPAPNAPRSPVRRIAPWAIAALILVALAAALVVPRLRSPATTPQRVLRSVVVLPEGQQLDPSGGTHPMALSPDGTMLVYSAVVGDRQLFIREMTAFEPTRVAGTTGAVQPFFSPDGKWIAFFAGGSLHKVAVSGGASLRICPIPRATRGGSWGAGDTIVFATVQDRLWRVPASGGTPQPIPNTDAGHWPEVLPDGKTVLFTTGPENRNGGAGWKQPPGPRPDRLRQRRDCRRSERFQRSALRAGGLHRLRPGPPRPGRPLRCANADAEG
jgi:eukaryotic-like serine/threonine-protein kinase